ncbi:MAG TPA: response regulator [Trinickia sp.]|jgi:FixJ family two-component response regulator|uniref:response regulator transcription factor n=1 Tax=Trinickia sp. TaxID=2571163 RepID=UPI002D12C232|nr:response regulator [Trinickia sp.]HTI19262.1 response regulator [Trinickia sp.]
MPNAKPFVAVVDDDESVGRALKRVLRTAGIPADAFLSGDDFVSTLASMPSYRPDCAIVDVQMPGLSGLDVLKSVVGQMPVILITAYEDADTRERALAAGAVDYLRKPFNSSALIQAVLHALGH